MSAKDTIDVEFLRRRMGREEQDLVTDLVTVLRPGVEAGFNIGTITHYVGSVGFTVSRPFPSRQELIEAGRDDIHRLVWLIGGWGTDWPRYAGNGIRKGVDVMAQDVDSSLVLRQRGHQFPGAVPSTIETGCVPNRPFPWAGFVIIEVADDVWVASNLSGLDEVNDDVEATANGKRSVAMANRHNPGVLRLPPPVVMAAA